MYALSIDIRLERPHKYVLVPPLVEFTASRGVLIADLEIYRPHANGTLKIERPSYRILDSHSIWNYVTCVSIISYDKLRVRWPLVLRGLSSSKYVKRAGRSLALKCHLAKWVINVFLNIVLGNCEFISVMFLCLV